MSRRTTPLRATTGLRRTPMRPAWPMRTARPRPDPVDAAARQVVRARSGGRCEIGVYGCAGPGSDWAHRKRRGEGDHRPVNGLWACRSCHEWCHAHPALAKAGGWMVPPWADPVSVPVWLRCRRRVWLTGEGGYGGRVAA